jgi:hypothetical protein
MRTFILHNGKEIVSANFKTPFTWDGRHGQFAAPSAARPDMKADQGKTTAGPPIQSNLPVAFDPGLGP